MQVQYAEIFGLETSWILLFLLISSVTAYAAYSFKFFSNLSFKQHLISSLLGGLLGVLVAIYFFVSSVNSNNQATLSTDFSAITFIVLQVIFATIGISIYSRLNKNR